MSRHLDPPGVAEFGVCRTYECDECIRRYHAGEMTPQEKDDFGFVTVVDGIRIFGELFTALGDFFNGKKTI